MPDPLYNAPASFKKRLSKKPPEMQAAVLECMVRVMTNPAHPGLRVHKMQGYRNVWEAYVDDGNRVTFERHGNGTIMFRNNCNHDMLTRNP